MEEEDDVELSFEDLTFKFDEEEDHPDYPKQPKISVNGEEEENKNVILITVDYSEKLNWEKIVKILQEKGPLKTQSFKEGQTFGFAQFVDFKSVRQAIEELNGAVVDGIKIGIEHCDKITPGRDPRTHNANSEFKNVTLVLKNLAFQLKQEKLEEILAEFKHKPLSVSYLYDPSGMFRGMAFVKYKEIEHATRVFEELNDRDILGRKVRIEYKRKTKETENQEEDLKKMADLFMSFKNDQEKEVSISYSSSFQRKQIHQLAEKFGFVHFSTAESENKVILRKKDEPKSQPIRQAINKKKIPTHNKTPSFERVSISPIEEGKFGMGMGMGMGVPISKSLSSSYERSQARLSPSVGFHTGSFGGNGGSYGTSNIPPAVFGSYGASYGSLGTSPNYKHSALILERTNEKAIQPTRQPKGPDATKGFSKNYQTSRSFQN